MDTGGAGDRPQAGMTARVRAGAALAALAFVLALVAAAQAQTYPSRPVRIIVPTVAGGTVDVITRLGAAGLSARLGATLLVDHRRRRGHPPGAPAAAPATRLARAKPRAASPTAPPC